VVSGGSNNSATDQSDNRGIITGANSQGTQIQNSRDFVINQGHVSFHPVTSDMNLKWNMDDFAESVRNGNLPAITEYLNLKDGFDPNTLWNGNTFVLELPIFEGTKNFPQILKLFKDTGKLNWKEVNDQSIWKGVYEHPITLEYSTLQQAANKNYPIDLKALIDAGANPSQLLADETKAFRGISRQGIFAGALTGKPTDMRGAGLEQDLATFRAIGYPLPNLQEGPTPQERADVSRQLQACEQDLTSHHSMKELMDLAADPQALDQVSTWQPYQMAASYLKERLLQGGWRGSQIEYENAVAKACSPNQQAQN